MDWIPLVSQLAEGQHSLVTRHQLLAAGLTAATIDTLVRRGFLHGEHPGVYRIAGSVHDWGQRQLAACLSVADDAVASHRAAARLWGLDGPFDSYVEVTGDPRVRAKPRGAFVHRSSDLAPHHVTVRHGIPVTNPVRTLVDLGAAVSQGVLNRAVDDALARRLVSYNGLLLMLAEVGRRGRRGVGKLRASLAERTDAPESVLEAEFQRLIRRSHLAEPEYQFRLETESGLFVGRIDAAYAELEIAIELDGASTHDRRGARGADEVRQAKIEACGWVVLRFGWADVVGRPDWVISRIEAEIERRRPELCFSARQIAG